MKIVKQLLPIVAVASIATPIVASCGCSSNVCSWSEGQTYKPMKPKQGKTIIGTNDDLTKEYGWDVKANKKIFSDDFVNFISRGGHSSVLGESMTFDVTSIRHKTTNVGDGNATLGGDDYAFPVSFTMTLTAEAKIKSTQGNISTVYYNKAKITFTNMPVLMQYMESERVLGKEGSIAQCLPIGESALIANKKWSINMPKLIYEKAKDIFILGENKIYSVENSFEELISEDNLLNAFSSFLSFFLTFESNYYYNIERKV